MTASALIMPALACVVAFAAGRASRAFARGSQELDPKPDAATMLRALAAATPGLLYAKDRSGRFLLANDAALEQIGKPWQDVEGRTDLELLGRPADAVAVMENDRRIMESGVPETIEETFANPDGHQRYWLSTKTPLRDDDRIVGIAGVSVDITERRLAEQRFRGLQAIARMARRGAMSELGYALTRELNQPLAAMVNHLEILRHQLTKSSTEADPALDRVSLALGQAARTTEIIRRLQNFSTEAPMQTRIEPVSAILDEAATLMSPFVAAHNVRIQIAPHPEDLVIFADTLQLQQVFLWLISELLRTDTEISSDTGNIEIGAFIEGDLTRLYIKHHNCGLSEYCQDSLDRKFSIADDLTDDVGIAISQRIMENHAGKLNYIASTEPTVTFTLDFPTPDLPTPPSSRMN